KADDDLSRQLVRKQVTDLLSQSGRVDEALDLIVPEEHAYNRGRIVEEAIVATAYMGDPQKAWGIYAENPDKPTELGSTKRALNAILEVALLKADFDTLKAVLDEIPDYQGRSSLLEAYRRHGDSLEVVTDWLMEKFLIAPHDQHGDKAKAY